MEEPPRATSGWHRGRRFDSYGYMITCSEVVRDESGEIVEIRCTYDRDTGRECTGRRDGEGNDPLGFGGAFAAL